MARRENVRRNPHNFNYGRGNLGLLESFVDFVSFCSMPFGQIVPEQKESQLTKRATVIRFRSP